MGHNMAARGFLCASLLSRALRRRWGREGPLSSAFVFPVSNEKKVPVIMDYIQAMNYLYLVNLQAMYE